MPDPANRILSKMLDRLFSALINGPSMNCKPHSSRQRIDLMQFAKLQDLAPEQVLRSLLSPDAQAKVVARTPQPRKKPPQPAPDDDKLPPEDKAAQQAWTDQQSFLTKLRTIAEDAKTYENDTGVHVLHIGFPLLSLPPGSFGRQRGFTRRILAPLAFISLNLTLKSGTTPSILLECKNEGADLVVANSALLSWLEQQTGKKIADLLDDESGEKTWEEICSIVQRIAALLELTTPPLFEDPATAAQKLKLQSAPRADDEDAAPTIVPSAVIGLFPAANQGLLRDMQALVEGEPITGPMQSFVQVDATLQTPDASTQPEPQAPVQARRRDFAEERLIASADPCQSRAVKLARTSKGLVVHGPPGTGKSQTISNIIGDHLARGQRVLLVCDKRTALDVVINRLESLGLSQLCAVIHDPQRDQRELYKAIREQLENLADTQTDAAAEGKLATLDSELQKLHDELTAYHAALMHANGQGASFHDLVGQWLRLPSSHANLTESALHDVNLATLEAHVRDLDDLLQRGVAVNYPKNPWVPAAGITLADFLSLPMDEVRSAVSACVEAAQSADATLHPAIPPWPHPRDLLAQGQARLELAEQLQTLLQRVPREILARWATADPSLVRQAHQKLTDAATFIDLLRAGPLDGELALLVRTELPPISTLGEQLGILDRYLAIANKWYAFFSFQTRSQARQVLSRYGLALTATDAQRLRTFLAALRARLLVQTLHDDLLRQPPTPGLLADDLLNATLTHHELLFDLLLRLATRPELAGLSEPISALLAKSDASTAILDGLRASLPRAKAIVQLEHLLSPTKLFDPAWLQTVQMDLSHNQPFAPTMRALADQLDTLDNILRIRDALTALPPGLRTTATQLLQQSVEPQTGLTLLNKTLLAQEITRRLKADPQLQRVDGQKLKTTFDRYRALDHQKKEILRKSIVHRWVTTQKQRLLATTGSRLNSMGADLRRRLTIRGERAMRLRQVIAIGQEIDNGDPLFDLRPVWMASPETVAQIFPRKSLFDVVIFDEASQCRLEEALPVLMRAHRVVIAGDPKQLPPTRFFESAVATSEEEELETDQDLFEAQQGEIEDLLGAALNIEIQECYLDVHYRSRNADLIGFSNEHFYGSRLQAIPGHPANRTRYAPLTLYKTNGVYDDRANIAEAEQVCRIVQDLLKRATPPSIGIATFNLQQRDLILEQLEDLAAQDSDFARRFAEARTRRSASSFEGLFVKNLENVQGDERDHIIISTTFGPDPKGRFYRRFGPLGRAGGGRRLNVLITRAREEVHLVTSIPESIYRALPPIPPGETPGGGWLLFGYLAYAEMLAEQYEADHQLLSSAQPDREPAVHVRPTRAPSLFAQSLAEQLAQRHQVGSDVHWGNDGFCVDLAMHHPRRVEDVTVGVLCDMTRYTRAEDPVEWEAFRTMVLESQGWRLHRLWTPHFFRDRQGCTDAILKDIAAHLATEEDKDAIKVTDDPRA